MNDQTIELSGIALFHHPHEKEQLAGKLKYKVNFRSAEEGIPSGEWKLNLSESHCPLRQQKAVLFCLIIILEIFRVRFIESVLFEELFTEIAKAIFTDRFTYLLHQF